MPNSTGRPRINVYQNTPLPSRLTAANTIRIARRCDQRLNATHKFSSAASKRRIRSAELVKAIRPPRYRNKMQRHRLLDGGSIRRGCDGHMTPTCRYCEIQEVSRDM